VIDKRSQENASGTI